MTIPHDLLDDLRSSPTDLAGIVEAVVRDGLPYVMIGGSSVLWVLTSAAPSIAGLRYQAGG